MTELWSAEVGPHDADLIALVHGSMDRSAGLLRLSRRLDDRFRVLRYDRRGYGRSRPHDGPFAIDDQVADLAALLDGRSAIVVGHSFGGDVALGLADRHPEAVRACIVYETPLSWYPWWPGSTAGALALDGDTDGAAERFMRRLIGDDRWDRLPSSTRAARRAEGVAMVGELSALRLGPAFDTDRVRCPVLALYGEHGADHHRRAMVFLAEQLPDCRAEEIPGARHFGPNSHADAVVGAIERFLDG